MHFFSADGKYVVFFDAFGLSTLELPTGKLRTDKGLSGHWFSANGGLALVHSERRNQRHARTLPGIVRATVGKGYEVAYSPTAMLADGKRAALANHDNSLVLYSVAKSSEASFKLPPGRKLEPFDLGPRLDPHADRGHTFVGTDDSYAVFSHDGTLFGGQLTKKGPEKAWSVKCGLPQGRVTAKPHASGTFVAAWHPALMRSFCAVIRDGEVIARGVDTISPATFTGEAVAGQARGQAIVFQPLPNEVVRETLDGIAESFTLPEGTHGAGELMAHGTALLFITPDRERVVDVTTGKVFDRKLGANLQQVRTTFIGLEQRYRELARAANQVVDLSCLELPAYGAQHKPDFHWDDGDLGFLRLVVAAWLVHTLRTENEGRYSLGSYSLPTSIRPIGAKEMLRDLEAIDAANIDLIPALAFVESPFKECWGGSDDEKVKVKPAMEKDAEQLLLHAVAAQLGSKKRVPLAKSAPKWGKQKLTPQAFIKALDPRDKSEAWADAQGSVAWLVLDFFKENALPVFIDWLIARPSPFARANSHIISDAPKKMMVQFPATKKKFHGALEVAKKKAKGELLQYLEGLEASLSW